MFGKDLRSFLLVLLVIFFTVLEVCGQYTIHHIKNFQRSNAIMVRSTSHAKVILDAYGKIVTLHNPSSLKCRYLFGGQEYDGDFGLYFYPSRLYSVLTSRFFQVDPKSQYSSPYVFVGGDPVNHIDHSGNEGKPLVLYNSDMTQPSAMEATTLDFRTQAGDAYYAPLTDLLNGKIGDMPEFNGTIFIKSHMSPNMGGTVDLLSDNSAFNPRIPVRPRTPLFIATNKSAAINRRPKFITGMKAEDLGKELRLMADAKGLNVKTIVAGGCHGSVAAESIGRGFTSKPSFSRKGGAAPKARLRTVGSNEDMRFMYLGDKTLAEEGFGAIGETRMYGVPTGYIHYFGGDRTVVPHKFDKVWMREQPSSPREYAADMVSGSELTNFAHEGRIPPSHPELFKEFTFEY